MVIPFRLKNAGATYQRAMSLIFCDHLRKMVECYVDDIAIKNRNKNNHLHNLRMVFDLMRAHLLKMNPTKSFLGVSGGKFLGLLPISEDSLQNLSGRCQPFTQLMKKDVSFIWDETYQKAFKDIQEYLTKPPVLVALVSGYQKIPHQASGPIAPISRKLFLLYVRVMDHSLGALLTQNNVEGVE